MNRNDFEKLIRYNYRQLDSFKAMSTIQRAYSLGYKDALNDMLIVIGCESMDYNPSFIGDLRSRALDVEEFLVDGCLQGGTNVRE